MTFSGEWLTRKMVIQGPMQLPQFGLHCFRSLNLLNSASMSDKEGRQSHMGSTWGQV